MGDPKATLAALIAALGRPCATARSPTGRQGSWRHGGETGRRRWPAMRRRSGRTGCATRSPGRCRRTAYWSRTPAIPASGAVPDRTERRGADICVPPDRSAGRSGGAGREMRGAASEGICWSATARLLPRDGTGDGQAARDRGGAGGQQQLRVRPGLAEHPASAGQQAGDVAELVRFGPRSSPSGGGVRAARHPGGGSVANRGRR